MTDPVISLPEGILDTMLIESTIFTPENQQIGVIVLSEFVRTKYILHIYQLALSKNKEHYQFVQELAAFKIDTRAEVDVMIDRLPNLSGLEMLLMLNPQHPFPSTMN